MVTLITTGLGTPGCAGTWPPPARGSAGHRREHAVARLLERPGPERLRVLEGGDPRGGKARARQDQRRLLLLPAPAADLPQRIDLLGDPRKRVHERGEQHVQWRTDLECPQGVLVPSLNGLKPLFMRISD